MQHAAAFSTNPRMLYGDSQSECNCGSCDLARVSWLVHSWPNVQECFNVVDWFFFQHVWTTMDSSPITFWTKFASCRVALRLWRGIHGCTGPVLTVVKSILIKHASCLQQSTQGHTDHSLEQHIGHVYQRPYHWNTIVFHQTLEGQSLRFWRQLKPRLHDATFVEQHWWIFVDTSWPTKIETVWTSVQHCRR